MGEAQAMLQAYVQTLPTESTVLPFRPKTVEATG